MPHLATARPFGQQLPLPESERQRQRRILLNPVVQWRTRGSLPRLRVLEDLRQTAGLVLNLGTPNVHFRHCQAHTKCFPLKLILEFLVAWTSEFELQMRRHRGIASVRPVDKLS